MFVLSVIVAGWLAGSGLTSGIESSYNLPGVGDVFSILQQLDPSSQKTTNHNLHGHTLLGNHGRSLQQQTIHQLGGIYGLIANKGLKHPVKSHDELGKVLQEIQRAQQVKNPRDQVLVSGFRRVKSGNRSTHGGKRFGDKLDLSFDKRRKRNRAEDGGFLEAVSHSKKKTDQYENLSRKEKIHKGGHSSGKGRKNSHHANASANEKDYAVRGKDGHLARYGLFEDYDLRGFMRGRQRGIGRYGYVPGRSKFGY